MVQRFWRAETGVFLGVGGFLLLAASHGALLRDPGVFWHRVVGERILSTGEFLDPSTRTDPFSFTFGGRPWIAQQWLAECLMALLYRIGGLDSLALATATILAALHAWVARRLIRAGFHWLFGVLLAVLVFFASAYHFHPRPHLATMVLLGWTLARLADVEAGRRSLRSLSWLVPVFILWTNLHGGVLGGMATVGLVVVGWAVMRGIGLPSPLANWRSFAFAGALVVTCGLTALVNPYGVQLLEVWRKLSNSPTLREFIIEHQPLDPSERSGRFVLLFAVVYMTALVGIRPRQLRGTWLIPLLWLYEAMTSIRHGPLFSISAAVVLADLLPQTRWASWLAATSSGLYTDPRRPVAHCQSPSAIAPPRRAVLQFAFCHLQLVIRNLSDRFLPYFIPIELVLAALVLQWLNVPLALLGRASARFDWDYWPVEALPQLSREREGAPVFNDMLYGGFLIAYGPHVRVFIDDRCELYGDDFLRQYFEAERDQPERIEQWANEYGFRVALVRNEPDETKPAFDHYLQNAAGWERIAKTPSANLYRRKIPAASNRDERRPLK